MSDNDGNSDVRKEFEAGSRPCFVSNFTRSPKIKACSDRDFQGGAWPGGVVYICKNTNRITAGVGCCPLGFKFPAFPKRRPL